MRHGRESMSTERGLSANQNNRESCCLTTGREHLNVFRMKELNDGASAFKGQFTPRIGSMRSSEGELKLDTAKREMQSFAFRYNAPALFLMISIFQDADASGGRLASRKTRLSSTFSCI